LRSLFFIPLSIKSLKNGLYDIPIVSSLLNISVNITFSLFFVKFFEKNIK
jgi:hypothetical protein